MSIAVLNGRFSRIHFWEPIAEVESAALDQLKNIAGLPWVRRIAVMPDVHLGKGATVGSVIAMKDAVSPAAVGVDIGCGMGAVRTNLTASDLPDGLHRIRSDIERVLPVGFASHDRPARHAPADELWAEFPDLHEKVQGLFKKAQ